MITLSQVESTVTILAIFVAGTWAFFRFFVGRVIAPRLDPSVSGQLLRRADRLFLVVRLHATNVGSVRIRILQRGTGLNVFSYPVGKAPTLALSAPAEYSATLDILKQYRWIEPGETAHDEQLLALPPGDPVAFRLECRIVYPNSSPFRKNTVKFANTIVDSQDTESAELPHEEV